MPANLLQIVDQLSASPTVLVNLNDETVFGAADLDVSPPRLRYSSSSSMLADGSRISSSSYENRELRLTFDVISTSQDNWAAAFQTLARAIDQDRFWVKYQPTGVTNPVFFNCYRASVDQVQDVAGATAYRTVDLTIIAEPGAYGLPESGSVTINNDPVSGTNPCFWNIGSSVKGDLEAPLFLTLGPETLLSSRTFLTASTALRYGMTQTAPNVVQLPVASGATWSGTTGTGDAAMSGGNYYRYTSTGAGSQGIKTFQYNSGQGVLAGAPFGDYRVFLRYRASNPTTGAWSVSLTQYDNLGGYLTGDDVLVPQQLAAWLDLGVFRFPFGAPEADPLLGTTPTAAATRISLNVTVAAGTVLGDTFDLDAIMFVPCGLDQVAHHQLAYTQVSGSIGSTSASLVLNGERDEVYVTNAAGAVGSLTIPAYIGGLPAVVPGAHNSLTLLRTAASYPGGATDAIAQTTTLNWKYWPRYLYVRPATT